MSKAMPAILTTLLATAPIASGQGLTYHYPDRSDDYRGHCNYYGGGNETDVCMETCKFGAKLDDALAFVEVLLFCNYRAKPNPGGPEWCIVTIIIDLPALAPFGKRVCDPPLDYKCVAAKEPTICDYTKE